MGAGPEYAMWKGIRCGVWDGRGRSCDARVRVELDEDIMDEGLPRSAGNALKRVRCGGISALHEFMALVSLFAASGIAHQKTPSDYNCI